MQIARFPFVPFEAPPPPVMEVPPSSVAAEAPTAEEAFVDLPTQALLTQEELAARESAARAEGLQEGMAKGLEQGRGERLQLDEKLADSLQHLTIALASVQNMYQEAMQEFRQASYRLSGAVALKIAGKALQEKPDEAIMQMLDSLIPDLVEQPSLVIGVHSEMVDHLQEKIIRLSSERGFAGQLKIEASAEVAQGDCTVVWEQGRAVLNQAALQQKVKDLLGV